MTDRLRRVPPLALTAAAWLFLAICQWALPPAGLLGQYFPNSTWSEPPARASVDREPSTAQLSRGWKFTPPDNFSVRWTGFLHVGRTGDYTFSVASDDGSTLAVDRQVVVDNSAAHGLPARTGRVHLEEGRHPIALEYAQTGGAYVLELSWAEGSGTLGAIPAWRLSPHPSRTPLLLIQWLAAILFPIATLALIVTAARACWPERSAEAVALRRDRSANLSAEASAKAEAFALQAAAALGLFIVLAILHTWPLATSPAQLSRNDNADTMLNEWTLAWVGHQLPRHPVDLFDANIFYPERSTLGLSEPLILPGLIAAPLGWAGAPPVLVYNLMLLAGFALTGWTACLVMQTWTGDTIAGLVAGMLVAFNAHTLTRLPHLQAQHAELLFLALLVLDRLLRRPRASTAVWLGVIVGLQALVSIYLFAFTIIGLLASVLVRPEDWTGDRARALFAKLASSAAIAAAVMLPFLWPYWGLRSRGFVRSLDEAAWFAASIRDYITTPARWYPWGGGNFALFPGAVTIVCAAAAIVSMTALRDRRARMCLACAIVGVLLSFGPAVVPGYETLYTWLPVMQAVRTTSRFGYLGIAGLAMLAGFGVADVRRRLTGAPPAVARAAAAAIVLLAALDPLAAPIELTKAPPVPALYGTIASEPNAVVAELPFPRPESVYLNAQYMLNSTAHWKPMLNGYSGITPPSYAGHFSALKDFPGEAAMSGLRAAGVTHIFVHLDQLEPGSEGVLERRHDLTRLGAEGGVALYRLEP